MWKYCKNIVVLFLNCDFFFFAFSFIHTFPFFLFLFSLAFCQPHTYTRIPIFVNHTFPLLSLSRSSSLFLSLALWGLSTLFCFFSIGFYFFSIGSSLFFFSSIGFYFFFFFSRSSSLFLFFSLFLSPTLFSSISFYQGSYRLLFFFLVLD